MKDVKNCNPYALPEGKKSYEPNPKLLPLHIRGVP
jgi:hypothetical protein